MLTLRTRIFIAISLLVLFILGISLFLFINYKKDAIGPSMGAVPSGDNELPLGGQSEIMGSAQNAIPENFKPPVVTTEENEKNAAKQLAKIFAERYGSYSNQNNYQNIKDVEFISSDALWAKLEQKIGAPLSGAGFYGVTTRAISAELKSWSGTGAKLEVVTIRQEDAVGVKSSKEQIATVDVVRGKDGNWYVDNFVWN